MFVVLQGGVTMSQRDGLGRVVPITTAGRGQFLGRGAQLSGRPRWSTAHADEDVEVLLLRPSSCAR